MRALEGPNILGLVGRLITDREALNILDLAAPPITVQVGQPTMARAVLVMLVQVAPVIQDLEVPERNVLMSVDNYNSQQRSRAYNKI